MTPRLRTFGVLGLALFLGRASPLVAQAPARAPAANEIETDPITCWWKSDKSAVHLAERFTVTLTCRLVETARLSVVPDLTQLEPTAVQLVPFEVLDGVRHEDITERAWRYFQFEYRLRLMGEEFFGQDVETPPLKLTYSIQSAQGASSLQGRDHAYVMPPLSMRILSLVPRNAPDIRDASRDTFADIEARRLRANTELVAAALCFAFATVLLGLGGARVLDRYRKRAPTAARAVGRGAVLRGCQREIGRVRSAVTREGWSPDLAGRALSALRVAGAVALSQPVAQTPAGGDNGRREGQLLLRHGVFRPKRTLVSAPTTADALGRELASSNGASGRTDALLQDLRESIVVLNATRYGRNGDVDSAALDQALEAGSSALRRLRLWMLWPVRTVAALARSAAALGGAVWSR